MREMQDWRGGLALALLAFLVPGPASAAEAPARYTRWEGASTLDVSQELLGRTGWDLTAPLASDGTGIELTGDPGPAGTLRSRTRVASGEATVPAGAFHADLWREEVDLGDAGSAWQYRLVGRGGITLALVRGPAGAGMEFPEPELVIRLEAGAALPGLRVYDDEIAFGIFPTDCSLGAGACDVGTSIRFAFDASPASSPNTTVPLAGITTQGYANGATFTNPPTAVWDFTPVPSLPDDGTYDGVGFVAETDVAIEAGETCNINECGFQLPGNDFMSRQDILATAACVGGSNAGAACSPLNAAACPGGHCKAVQTNALFDKTFICIGGDTPWDSCDPQGVNPCPNGACRPAALLVAGVQQEGTNNENRFCYDYQPDTATGANRGRVPQWLFPHQDGGRYYMEVGDAWESPVFQCTLNLFNKNCGASIPLIPGELKTSVFETQGRAGKFTTQILNEGSVKLPSGHWIDTLVLQQLAEFSAFGSGSSCSFFALQNIRQPVVLFMAPTLGIVAQINGPLNASDPTTWTGINETVIRAGLLPPLDIQAGPPGDTSVHLTWDPGDQFGAIGRVKVYWDTDSGSASDYAFNSDDNAGQVAFDAPGPQGFPLGATVSGLAPGTGYHFTITFLRSYTQPDATPYTVEYETLRFPDQIQGTIGGAGGTPVSYPIEVQATTTNPGCTPTAEVGGLTLTDLGGGQVQFDWTASADPCLDHYILLGSDDPSAAGSFTPVADTGTATTFTGSPSAVYYLVVAEGAGGQRGPLGHFGQ